jgi:nicotinamide-nucleotide amidase
LLTDKVNSNSVLIGEHLFAMGINVSRVTTVGDSLPEMTAVFSDALNRSDIIISTGGLGPTFDDLTRQAVSQVTGRALKEDTVVLETIRGFFARRKAAMPENNRLQAQVLEGAEVLNNPNGTAPGQLLEFPDSKHDNKKKLVALLPGPPREMLPMLEAIAGRLKPFSGILQKRFVLRITGIGESLVEEKLRPVLEAERKLESGVVNFGIVASHDMIIDMKATVSGTDEMEIDETIKNIKKEFRDILGDHVFGEGRQTLEGAVGELLSHKKQTLALAESCTGGMVAARITNQPGSSAYFLEGIVTYSNTAKERLLKVNPETILAHGAVSQQTAVEMAEGVRSISGADYAMSITGIAGPGGGTAEKPVGLVYIGLVSPAIKEVFKYQFSGTRGDIRTRAANTALDILRRYLLNPKGR